MALRACNMASTRAWTWLRRRVVTALQATIRKVHLVTQPGALIGAQVVIASKSEENDIPKLQTVDPKKLTASYLIRKAAAANVDTSTSLLNQTTATLLDINQKYVDAVQCLLKLQEQAVGAHGKSWEEDQIWETMLLVRKQVNDYKAAKQELQLLYGSIERLVNNAAEAAYLAGAEYASSVANERLFAAQSAVKEALEHSQAASQSLSLKEAWVVRETMRREEDKKKNSPNKDDKQESVKSGDDNKSSLHLAEDAPVFPIESDSNKED